MKIRPRLHVAAMLLALAAPAFAAAPICDGSTALTLIGMDTAAGRTLFAIPATGTSQAQWIVELDAEGREARAYPDDPKGRFGASVGPGPVVAVHPCGSSCLQPVQWKDGSWEPLGDHLAAPEATTVAATYDRTGVPWILLYGHGATAGQLKAWAFRLENRVWMSRGSMEVAAVGEPQTLPAPQRKDGILTGTGLFSASGPPEAWVTGLPSVPAARRGQLIALTGTSAAYVSGDGVVYLSDNSGKAWRRSTWTPWGAQDTVGIWRQGKDYWVDLPSGDHRGALRLAWFDHRRPSDQVLVLTRLGTAGEWLRLTESPAEVKTKNDEHLPVTQVLTPQGDTWLLLSGCAATAEGSGLVLRVFDGKAMSAAKFLTLKAAGNPGN
ncbi:MAG TPA: hypothetical protein VGS07_28330 [Thermoanaerobaculia bacterium]|jgi:hypothetical protein|nr:hypothetical protein [Thermoanaerobaculia bacterium]